MASHAWPHRKPPARSRNEGPYQNAHQVPGTGIPPAMVHTEASTSEAEARFRFGKSWGLGGLRASQFSALGLGLLPDSWPWAARLGPDAASPHSPSDPANRIQHHSFKFVYQTHGILESNRKSGSLIGPWPADFLGGRS